jgi:hypothetical protein
MGRAFVGRGFRLSAGPAAGAGIDHVQHRREHVGTHAASRSADMNTTYTPMIDPLGGASRLALILVFVIVALITAAHVATIA